MTRWILYCTHPACCQSTNNPLGLVASIYRGRRTVLNCLYLTALNYMLCIIYLPAMCRLGCGQRHVQFTWRRAVSPLTHTLNRIFPHPYLFFFRPPFAFSKDKNVVVEKLREPPVQEEQRSVYMKNVDCGVDHHEFRKLFYKFGVIEKVSKGSSKATNTPQVQREKTAEGICFSFFFAFLLFFFFSTW